MMINFKAVDISLYMFTAVLSLLVLTGSLLLPKSLIFFAEPYESVLAVTAIFLIMISTPISLWQIMREGERSYTTIPLFSTAGGFSLFLFITSEEKFFMGSLFLISIIFLLIISYVWGSDEESKKRGERVRRFFVGRSLSIILLQTFTAFIVYLILGGRL